MSHDKNLVGGSGFGYVLSNEVSFVWMLYFQVDISILMFLIGTSSAELTAISIWVLACRPLVHFMVFLWKKRTRNASYKENTSRERSLDRSYDSQCQKMNKKTFHWCPWQSSTEKMDHEADPRWLGLKLSLVWLKTGLKDEVSQVSRHVGVAVAHGLRNYMYWIWTWECRESVWVTGTEQPCQEPVSPLVWNCWLG